jgi:hypothetical protein
MNYKEALAEIKYQLKDVDGYDTVYWDCVPTAILNVCAEALEKQIPKKVKKIRQETILGYAVTVHCPVCGGSVWQNADESKYCFRCGQAIDWMGNR